MEKQRIDRIMEMIQSNESLRNQYKQNPEATINVIYAWLDAEDQGKDLDPYFSQKEALENEIKRLEHDLMAYQERGLIAEAEIIVNQIFIKRRRLALIGREDEFPEEVAELRALENNLAEGRIGLYEYKNKDEEKQGPTL